MLSAIDYNGTIEVISGFKPINNKNFPLMEAHHILYSAGGVRLDDLLAGFTGSIKTYVDNAIISEATIRAANDNVLLESINNLENMQVSASSTNGNIKIGETEIKVYNDTDIYREVAKVSNRVTELEESRIMVETDNEVYNESFHYLNIIESNEDLNNLTTEGAYCLKDTTITITNKPSEVTGDFRLECKRLTESQGLMQTLYPYGDPTKFYIRYYVSNTWSSWYKYFGTKVD